MTRKIFLLGVVLSAAIICMTSFCNEPSTASANEVNASGIKFFKGSWKEVMEKATKENKPIFLDIYATWCGPCKMLKRQTFPDKKVGQFYNDNFINVTYDGERGDGEMLATKYRIPGYPTLIIFDKQGTPVHSTAGFLPPAEFLEFGKEGIAKIK